MAIRVEVKIGALTLRDREVEHLEIAQELGQHHRLSITFHRDPSKPIKLADFVSPAVTVTFTDDVSKTTATPFVGLIDSCEEQHQLRGGSIFIMVALSDSAKFSARHHKGNAPGVTILDLLGSFDVKIGSAPPIKPVQDYRQHGESDFEFLRRLADDHDCFLRPIAGGLELRHGFDSAKPHDLTWGKNLQAMTSRIIPRNARFKGAYYEFQRKGEVGLFDREQNPPVSGATDLTDAVKQQARTLQVAGVGNIYDSISRSTNIVEFRDAVQREAERRSGAAVRIEGTSTNIELLVGDTVDIREGTNFKLGNAPGVVGLTSVTHRFDGNQYSNSFVASPWTNFSNYEQPARQRVFGLTNGEVIDNVDPLKLGRIKIRLRDSVPGGPSELFARYMTPFAGNERGIAFLPEVGDEVMIGYEEGDPEHPYIIGAVWNGADVSPGPTPKRIVTKSGNAIVMDDAGMIEIHSPSGTCLVQLSNGVNGAARITISSGGDLFLEAADRIQLKCKNLVELVDKDATRIVKGDEQTSVQGARFVEVAGEEVHQSDTRIAFLAGGASTIEMSPIAIVSQGNQMVSIAKAQNVVQGLFVLLNPPGLVMPPTQGSVFIEPESKDSVDTGRANPKPTTELKVTREDAPT